MSGSTRREDIELLRRAIDSNEARKPNTQPPPDRRSGGGPAQIMYRGQPVNGRGGGRTPGAPGGAPAGRPARGGGEDLRGALQNLADLHADGLISQADYDRKRTDILDRM